ncbi:MAG: phosphotyrosine protein phosphatase [Spirochaetaceae bacterium]|nr:MAG: phosphotyrosine protein phosphatase [Spirochaetaceae bacterium]
MDHGKENKQRVLFVCTANQQRSPTAEEMYRNDPRFEVRSAGTDALMGREVTAEDLQWADLVVVMEQCHANKIRAAFPAASAGAQLIVLGIPDVYEYMEQTLQREIRSRFEAALPLC